MQLFKHTVALEACPAKTAESVSYGATFFVLGWLLLTNYSGFGNASGADEPLISARETNSGPLVTGNSVNESEVLSIPGFSEIVTADLNSPSVEPEKPLITTENEQQTTSPGELETDLNVAPTVLLADFELPAVDDKLWLPEFKRLRLREKSLDNWLLANNEAKVSIPTTLIRESFELKQDVGAEDFTTFKLFASELDDSVLLATIADSEMPNKITSTDPASKLPIHEIAVNGTESDRLFSRPDKIQRPQLPRPYRAQTIQRALILPPRVQALRP